jgi:hypothetical protein
MGRADAASRDAGFLKAACEGPRFEQSIRGRTALNGLVVPTQAPWCPAAGRSARLRPVLQVCDYPCGYARLRRPMRARRKQNLRYALVAEFTCRLAARPRFLESVASFLATAAGRSGWRFPRHRGTSRSATSDNSSRLLRGGESSCPSKRPISQFSNGARCEFSGMVHSVSY